MSLGRCFNLVHLATIHKVDIFVCSGDRLREEEIRRAVEAPVAGLVLPVISAEDAVVSKLRWYRDGGEVSQTQWRDVLDVISIQGPWLDQPYMEAFADGLGVADLLARALAEADT
ncbi:MAG: hypothetical protein HYU66_24460 [Armatimonadetes bacterium]|nr:hypothetical protein [Armatimonadota bacterium]